MLLYFLQAVSDPNAWNETIAKATVVIAVCTVLYLIATVLLWLTIRRSVNITKDMFEASHRPYVGIVKMERIDITENGEDEDGGDGPLKSIIFQMTYKNVGSVPAHSFKPGTRVVVDGIMLPLEEPEEEEFAVILPSVPHFSQVEVDDPKEIKQVINASVLSLNIKFTYKGVAGKEYSYEQKAIYHKEHDAFDVKKVIAT